GRSREPSGTWGAYGPASERDLLTDIALALDRGEWYGPALTTSHEGPIRPASAGRGRGAPRCARGRTPVINPASTMTGRKLTLFLAGLLTLVGPGCAGFMDKVTSKDFEFSSLFAQPNPLMVLRDSTDGRARAEALRSLREPKQHGGTDQDQDLVVEVLTKAAWNEHYVFCRLAAINTLRHFKDPRAVEGLKEAYYRATSFPPD